MGETRQLLTNCRDMGHGRHELQQLTTLLEVRISQTNVRRKNLNTHYRYAQQIGETDQKNKEACHPSKMNVSVATNADYTSGVTKGIKLVRHSVNGDDGITFIYMMHQIKINNDNNDKC